MSLQFADKLRIAQQIEKIILRIRDEGSRSDELIEAKASACSLYDCELAKHTVILRDDGVPATLIPAQAKGKVSDLLLTKILAEEKLKAHFKRLEYLQSQLTGYQSINKYFDAID